jgi:hypothetical protein
MFPCYLFLTKLGPHALLSYDAYRNFLQHSNALYHLSILQGKP